MFSLSSSVSTPVSTVNPRALYEKLVSLFIPIPTLLFPVINVDVPEVCHFRFLLSMLHYDVAIVTRHRVICKWFHHCGSESRSLLLWFGPELWPVRGGKVNGNMSLHVQDLYLVFVAYLISICRQHNLTL